MQKGKWAALTRFPVTSEPASDALPPSALTSLGLFLLSSSEGRPPPLPPRLGVPFPGGSSPPAPWPSMPARRFLFAGRLAPGSPAPAVRALGRRLCACAVEPGTRRREVRHPPCLSAQGCGSRPPGRRRGSALTHTLCPPLRKRALRSLRSRPAGQLPSPEGWARRTRKRLRRKGASEGSLAEVRVRFWRQ